MPPVFPPQSTQAISATRRGSRAPLLLCIASAAIPFLAVQVSYLLAAEAGSVPWCIPYIDSCTSISATGRSGTASYVFRGAMLPSSILIAAFWWLHWRWMRDAGSTSPIRLRSMLWLGWTACLGLVLYVSVLGEAGELWRLQRRIGTVLFFSFTFLAQLLLAAELRYLPAHVAPVAPWVGRWLLRLCWMMLFIGVFSVIIQTIDEHWHDAIEDGIEWQLALLLQLNFLICSRLWWRSDWHLGFHREEQSGS